MRIGNLTRSMALASALILPTALVACDDDSDSGTDAAVNADGAAGGTGGTLTGGTGGTTTGGTGGTTTDGGPDGSTGGTGGTKTDGGTDSSTGDAGDASTD